MIITNFFFFPLSLSGGEADQAAYWSEHQNARVTFSQEEDIGKLLGGFPKKYDGEG